MLLVYFRKKKVNINQLLPILKYLNLIIFQYGNICNLKTKPFTNLSISEIE